MTIEYKSNHRITVQQFIEVLEKSTLADRRPVDDRECIAGMLEHANVLVTAWSENQLVGVARSVTDFNYCCYLSDLAVDKQYQKSGIGRGLLRATQSRLGPKCKIILLSAPAAVEYYPHIGFDHHSQAWILPAGREIAPRE